MSKRITAICLLFLMCALCVYADSADELSTIREQLENKTIQNFGTIMAPLKGEPENFNILPEDDLETISFGEGVAGYTVTAEMVNEAYESGKEQISSYLVQNGTYYFPIIVSDRVAAMAEIVKTDDGYRVFGVFAGSISEHFAEAVKEIDITHAKYITAGAAVTGLLAEEKAQERFVDLDRTENDVAVQSAEKSAVEQLKEKFDAVQGSGDKTGGGVSRDEKKRMPIAVGSVIASAMAVGIYVMIKKKNA